MWFDNHTVPAHGEKLWFAQQNGEIILLDWTFSAFELFAQRFGHPLNLLLILGLEDLRAWIRLLINLPASKKTDYNLKTPEHYLIAVITIIGVVGMTALSARLRSALHYIKNLTQPVRITHMDNFVICHVDAQNEVNYFVFFEPLFFNFRLNMVWAVWKLQKLPIRCDLHAAFSISRGDMYH